MKWYWSSLASRIFPISEKMKLYLKNSIKDGDHNG